MAEPVTTVLGFDFGSRRIGVAVGQTLTRQATPLGAIKSIDWQAIEQLIDEWQPERLIVGLPLNLRGEQQEMSKRAARFARQLEGRYGLRSALVDERLTTREAYRIAIEDRRKKSRTDIDSLAAALITESWLNHNSDSGPQ